MFQMLAKILILWLGVTLIAASSISSPVTEKVIRKCQPNLCELAKFKCISTESCNGTLVPSTDPCQCCPTCEKFRGNYG